MESQSGFQSAQEHFSMESLTTPEIRNLARSELERTGKIFFLGHESTLGDTVIQTGIFRGIKEACKVIGKNPHCVFFADDGFEELVEGLGDQNQKDLFEMGSFSDNLKRVVQEESTKNPFILNFRYGIAECNVIFGNFRDDTTTIYNAYHMLIEGFSYTEFGMNRYAKYVEYLFRLPDGSIDPQLAKPRITIPKNQEEIYASLVEKHEFDSQKKQVAVVLEASDHFKRYSVTQYAQAISLISQVHPDIQFSIITKSFSETFSEAELKATFKEAGVLHLCTFVQTNLQALSVLFLHQDLVISNDTGLAHLAAAIEGGPEVIMLFSSIFSLDEWRSSDKQIPLEPPNKKKGKINDISPTEIANIANNLLLKKVV